MNTTHKLLRFGVFELNLDTEELHKSGTVMKLAPQPFRLLALLASHAGQVVTREEIKEQLWGEETYVDFEQGMNHCVKQIRTALGDNADNPLYVETLPRRGYRFLAPVVSKNVLAPAPQIIKSQSGVQSGVVPALTPEGRRAAAGTHETALRPENVTARNEPVTTSVAPAYSTSAVVREERVTSATAAAEALAPEIARLRESHDRTRQLLTWIVVVIVLLVGVAVYWQLHRP